MKILYAIQGTGNGHLARASALIPAFEKFGQVDVLLSGVQSDIEPPFAVKYNFHGLSFIFGEKGGPDVLKTFANVRAWKLIQEVRNLPVHEYDLVVSDFEVVSAWACLIRGKKCIGLSNQQALTAPGAPQGWQGWLVGRIVLWLYAPASKAYGYHFERYNPNLFTPVIRTEVRHMQPENLGHYTVYLPAHNDERIVRFLSSFPDVRWEVFSKHGSQTYTQGSVHVRPVNSLEFLESLRTCAGVFTAAGFGTNSEALYLGKKICVVPMSGQFEQHCNAKALKKLGATVLPWLTRKNKQLVHQWLDHGQPLKVDYPDNALEIAEKIVRENTGN